MKTALSLLMLEDSENDAALLLREISREFEVVSRRAQSAAEFRAAMKEGPGGGRDGWDMILSDYMMPQFTAMDALEILKEFQTDIPFIVVSGTVGEDVAVEIMRRGADDYLLKDNTKRLIPAVARELRELAARRRQKEAERALIHSEAQLRQAQKMEAIGRLAGGVAHDFNNLLTAILGYTELVIRDLGPKGNGVQELSEVKRCAERAASLTRQLLAFSRRQVLRPRVMDLNAVVTDMNAMSRRLIGEDVQLRCDLDPGLSKITADPGQMEQIIMNLVVNARDAMPRGGTITLKTSHADLSPADVEKFPEVKPGRYVALSVRDTGEGMTEEVRERLFEPFFTTKEEGKGTGLGLAMVYGIVKQSGGHIVVESVLGEGSIFHIYLPPGEETNAVVGEAGTEPVLASLNGTETILLVEDEAPVRDLARRVLMRHGYEVLEAANAGEALLACEKHAGPIHAMLTDMVMPKMNGYDLARRLTADHPDMRVIFMSGHMDPEVIKDVVKEGRPILFKPFRPENLARTVRETLNGAGASGKNG